ncbi:hypothetical protein EUX98_g5213 [Antrodiella citrinella]|uniref:Protein kinase domain-containing protein n=1 Tax=Antrodiella citrinella TaxID=2447956 RepID=A0A4S4MZW5_9APHY|nr:hypothetical protein EUX98_g5213 [Antrodiella citrinella]
MNIDRNNGGGLYLTYLTDIGENALCTADIQSVQCIYVIEEYPNRVYTAKPWSLPSLDVAFLQAARSHHIDARLNDTEMADIENSTSSTNDTRSNDITVLKLVDSAIPSDDPKDATDDSGIATEDAQEVMDKLWDLLGTNPSSEKSKRITISVSENRTREIFPEVLFRLCVKLAGHHRKLPSAIILQNVQRISNESEAAGGFADIHSGQYGGQKVALKSLRANSSEASKQSVQDEMLKEFCREVILWSRLRHIHILPLLGVSEHAEAKICMVLPWEDRGNVKDRIIKLRENGTAGDLLVSNIHKWLLHVAFGLDYLHEEKIVHGDLHGGNILIDELDNARLTDFGLGVIADATPLNYASKHGGGGYSHRAPELHDPEAFGTKSTRPTPSSDVYAFACTAIELYTAKPPFSDQSLFQIGSKVVKGERPGKPLTAEGVVMSNSMWRLTQQCWAQNPKDRPAVKNIVRDMKIVVSGKELLVVAPEVPKPSAEKQQPLEVHSTGCQCYIA